MRVFRVKALSGLVSLCAVVGALAFSASSAFAAEERGRVLGNSFGEGQLSLLAPNGTEAPGSGVAVNQTSGDVYVADTLHHRVEQFSSAGAFIRAWGWGVSDGAAEAEVCTIACLPGIAGSAPGQFETPVAIAVDNSPGGEGDVYVAEFAGFKSPDSHVQKFSAEGALVKAWGVEGQLGEGPLTEGESFFDIGGIGVGPAGELWAGTPAGTFEFEPGDTFVRLLFTGGNSAGLALDTLGDLFVLNEASVEALKFTSAGIGQGSVLQVKNQPTGIALDDIPAEEVFVDEGDQVAHGPSSCATAPCTPVGRFGAGQLSGGAGLAVDSQSDTVFVADTGAQRIDAFVPEPPGPPSVASESVAEVTANSATFEAELNPRSESGEAATEYEFRYGPCATPSTCASSGYEKGAPAPAGSLAASFEAQSVSAHVSDLLPRLTYHFKVVARNNHGSSEGEKRSFITQGAGGRLALADGRQWEMVSSPDKQGAQIEPISEVGVVQAAGEGNGITYLANAPSEAGAQGNAASSVQVLSRRGAAGWSSRDIAIPHVDATGTPVGGGPEYKLFSPELASALVQPFGQFNPRLSSEASESTPYLHSLEGSCGEGCYRPLVSGKPGFENVPPGSEFGEGELCEPRSGTTANIFCGPRLLGASDDLGHVVLRSKAALKAGAGEEQLYEWSGGSLARVSVLPGPGEEPAPDGTALFGLSDQAARRAISNDGSRVVWESESKLYVRDTARGETVQLDKGCPSCGSGEGRFQIASADGSRIFFTDSTRLSEDAGQTGADLYECKMVMVGEHLTCALSDLTPASGTESARVQGGVLGASEDGSWVYFVAEGVLSGEPNARGESASAGQANLYVMHEGSISFITTLATEDSFDWHETLGRQPARVAPDGEWVEFMSQASPTGYDNRDLATGRPVAEVYLYGARAERVFCASCDPSGGRPSGIEFEKLDPGNGGLVGGPRGLWPSHDLVAANVPGWTAIGAAGHQAERHQPRYLSNSGRLFFNTLSALVPQDANGTEDVYEYEPPGVGACTSSSESFGESSGGCVGLISSGSSSQESAFLDASESGGDVFFLTVARLSPLDVDDAYDVYDAHECTSASPCIAVPQEGSPPCDTEASCKASPSTQPTIFGAPSSATFSGPGNLVASGAPKPAVKSESKSAKCRKGFVKKHDRCVKKKKKSKKPKKSTKGRK